MSERLIAIDPSLRCSGFAILESDGRHITSLEYGIVRNAQSLRPSDCLVVIHERVRELLVRWKPSLMAIESVIYVQSHRTAITIGAARGCAILAAAQAGIPVHEYAPRRVKQAVVGVGSAQKSQVAFMVRAALRLTETPPPDAADALAIGLAHFQAAASPLRQVVPHERI
jgi:crossover junction endodeoxyribonuclease RuvC